MLVAVAAVAMVVAQGQAALEAAALVQMEATRLFMLPLVLTAQAAVEAVAVRLAALVLLAAMAALAS